MAALFTRTEALRLWHAALAESVRRDGPDLSARQMAILLTVHLADEPHTVRGLAAGLRVSKPAVTRALDRLAALGYVERTRDERDRRNVLVQPTDDGAAFLNDFAALVGAAGVAIRA